MGYSIEQTVGIPERLDKDLVRSLSQVRNAPFLAALGFDLLLIAAAVWASEAVFFHPLVYACAVVIIGGRLHAFGVLMHEATHRRALSNRFWNDAVGELMAWCLLLTLHAYRQNHLAHHAFLNTEQDPDWQRKQGMASYAKPGPRAHLLLELVKYVSAVAIIQEFSYILRSKSFKTKPPRHIRLARLAFYLTVLSAGLWFGVLDKIALYWLVPLLTTFGVYFYLRSAAEHFGAMEYDHVYTHSRNVYPHAWERLFFAPHHVNYHLDHHLYPNVPFHALPKLHKALLEMPLYRQKAHITRGYTTGVMRELAAVA